MSRLTVFMPVYNEQNYLREAIDSILSQTYEDFVFLVIDDGSTDSSREILNSYNDSRMKIIFNEENKGISYTRNLGLELCDTEFIAFMDADDIAPLYRLEKEVEYLDRHLEMVGVGGYAEYIDKNGETVKNYNMLENPKYIKAHMVFENVFANGSMMLRTKIIKENNLKYRNLSYAEDYCFHCEILQFGLMGNLRETMQFYRVVDNGLSAKARENIDIMHNSLDFVHEMQLKLWGFELEPEKRKIFLQAFRHDGEINSEKELKMLYLCLKDMVEQAEESQDMIKIACRKMFGRALTKCFWLWE